MPLYLKCLFNIYLQSSCTTESRFILVSFSIYCSPIPLSMTTILPQPYSCTHVTEIIYLNDELTRSDLHCYAGQVSRSCKLQRSITLVTLRKIIVLNGKPMAHLNRVSSMFTYLVRLKNGFHMYIQVRCRKKLFIIMLYKRLMS